jgi:hypothetical protein
MLLYNMRKSRDNIHGLAVMATVRIMANAVIGAYQNMDHVCFRGKGICSLKSKV